MSAIFGETLRFSGENGCDVELIVFGDEFYARYETPDGYTVVFDADRQQFCYAEVLHGTFSSSGAPISKPPAWGLKKHLKESEEVRNRKFEQRFARMATPEPMGDPLMMRTFGANEGLLPGRRVSQGTVRGLTILVEFNDLTTSVTADDLNSMLNGDNYTRNGNYCSVRRYFKLISSGKLDYVNEVVGPIKLSRPRSYYQSHLLVQEALDIAVNEFNIDLGRFDSRGEGFVDALNILYAGRTVYAGELWPHNFNIDLNYNGIRTHFYMLSSAGRHPVDLSIGTFCHENGHQLCRFPDVYDYGRRDGDFEKSQGMGIYCLMGSGNHLNNGRTPSPICAYLRRLVGWYDREVILNSAAPFATRHGDFGTIMKHETDTPNEFFLVENRSRMGLDAHLPSSGLAVYHCDTLGSNEWQGGSRNKHYQCGILQADGHLDLENNRNPGDAGDLYGESAGVALSDETTPSTRAWDGSDSGLIISNISEPGEVINFTVGRPALELVARGMKRADLLIPDAQVEGVKSVIQLSESGRLQSISVSVDITHTYIGDLVVELESPSGTKIILHDREGGFKDDLKLTYSMEERPGLIPLEGEDIRGDWTLHVTDLARRDSGRLNFWSIEIAFSDTLKTVSAESTDGLAIPDFGQGEAKSTMMLDDFGQLADITVSVAIAHTYIGDLMVELFSPSGQSVLLHNRTGGGTNDLRMTFDRNSVPGLEILQGVAINGPWQLRVVDLARLDTGVLEKWSLEVRFV